MVDAGDVCLSTGDFECKSLLKFTVNRPSFCKAMCCNENLIISGCSIDIVCLVVTLVIYIICIANKTRSQPLQLSFMNVCIAQLGLFVFFLWDVITVNVIIISFFVDCFLFISVSCVLLEAVAICISVLDKTVHRNMTIAGVSCCWGLPLLKSIITVAVDSKSYYSSGPEEYFLGTGRPLNTAEIVIITPLFCATIAAIGYSVFSLCHASTVNGKEEEKQRHEAWLRIGHISAICLCFFSWIIALLDVGICRQPFCIVFIVFALPQGIVILVGFGYRITGKKEFCESSGEDNPGRSSSVSPLQDGDEKKGNTESIQINSMGATGKAD
eukprot:XP_003729464.2 PREDICTED: probable G-protein coupled receptor 133 [Strongylocentrotus purpuratus]